MDRTLARALVDAGYMPLADYVAKFGSECGPDFGSDDVSIVPTLDHEVEPLGLSEVDQNH